MRLELLRLILGIAALALVVIGAVKVLLPFVQPILWAAILGSATWPAYRHLRRWFGQRETLAALTMTTVLVLVVVVPLVFLSLAMVREIEPTMAMAQEWAESGQVELPDWAKSLPGVEEAFRPWKDRLTDTEQREQWLRQAVWPAERVLRWSRNVLRQVVVLVLTVFTLFFVYRDGDNAAREARWLLDKIAGGGGKPLLGAVRLTVRAVFFGWLLTAAAQGLVSMIGYWVVGLHAPVLLGVATGFAAVIPFGVGLVWIPAVASLFLAGSVGKAIFLAAWSIGVVSVIDNFLRPLFISGPSKIPFVLVFFGVMGGLVVFGPLGLVLGPVFLAVLLALWRQMRENLDQAGEYEATGTV
jgi:predicted PurR-regulated permease PerM